MRTEQPETEVKDEESLLGEQRFEPGTTSFDPESTAVATQPHSFRNKASLRSWALRQILSGIYATQEHNVRRKPFGMSSSLYSREH